MSRTEQLWLEEPRNVLAEPQAAFHLAFDGKDGIELQRLFDTGYLTMDPATTLIETVGGVLMAQPELNLDDMAVADWTLTGTDWSAEADGGRPWPRTNRSSGSRALSFRGDGQWQMRSVGSYAAGAPFFLRWVSYATNNANQYVQVGLAGWRMMQLNANGDAAYYRWDGSQWRQACPAWRWMVHEQYGLAQHWLMVYELGPRLVVRTVQRTADGKALGLSYLEPSPYTVETEPVDGALLQTVANHALPAGRRAVLGYGPVSISLVPVHWPAGKAVTLGLAAPQPVGIAGEGKTTAAAITLSGTIAGSLPAVNEQPVVSTLIGATATPWPQGDEAPLAEPEELFRWEVGWTTSADSCPLITSVDVVLPATYESDGSTGWDAYAEDGLAVTAVRATRSPEPQQESLSATLAVWDNARFGGRVWGYGIHENTPVRWVMGDGATPEVLTTLSRGYTTDGKWQNFAERSGSVGEGEVLPDNPFGTLSLEAQAQWKRFTKAHWPGGTPGDGCSVADLIYEVLTAAGLADAEIEIDEFLDLWPIIIPPAPEGHAPAVVWRPGTTIDRVLTEILDKWLGPDFTAGFDLASGHFAVDLVTPFAGVPVASFYELSSAAKTAGKEHQVVFDGTYDESMDASGFANLVTVIGQDPSGGLLLARQADWASIRGNGDADEELGTPQTFPDNYVGEPWPLVVMDPGLQTQAAVNWCCRKLYDRVRKPRIYARWKSLYVELYPGDIVTLIGPNYGGDVWRITGVVPERGADGDGILPQGAASYAAEYVQAAEPLA